MEIFRILLMSSDNKDDLYIDSVDGELITEDEQQAKEPPMFNVLLLNDDYTTMDFVVDVLRKIFRKSVQESEAIMLTVHKQGKGLAGTYTKDVAETKIATVHVLARQKEYPLKCKLEPVH